MQILLMRHGEAIEVSLAQMADEERPLTKTGREELERACRCYADVVAPPQRLFHSPLLRARQSAEILANACDIDFDRATEERALTPASRPSTILDVLQGEALAGTRSVAVVGHEPHLGSLLGLLLTGGEQHALPMHKGMLVRVDLDTPQTLLGRLQLCLTPRDCAELAPRA